MARGRRWLFMAVVILVLTGLDQVTKYWAIHALNGGEVLPQPGQVIMAVFPSGWHPSDLFHITYAVNTGAFLSLGQSLPDGVRFWVLTGLNTVILSVVTGVLVLMRQLSFKHVLPLTLILAGGLGNLIDRVVHDGLVVDFMNMGIGPRFRTGVFNVADVAIMAGLFLLLFVEFFLSSHGKQKEVKADGAPEATK
jgi:signal peptidase II